MIHNKVVVITGPTGVGKTLISLEIAKHFQTDIINGDAYQVYQKMDLGTAKASKEEQKQIKHHLIDIISPLHSFSVKEYQQLVRNLITVMQDNHKLPLIVGGSGLYIEAVVRNYQFLAPQRQEQLYHDLSDRELHQVLEKLDIEGAQKIPYQNRKRVIRAIELIKTQDLKTRTLRNEFIYDTLVIFLNDERSKLYERINNRVDKMISEGLVNEVKQLYPDGLGPTAKEAIGYKELYQYFDGHLTLEEAIDKIKINSRHYAKRQITWWRNKEKIIFINIEDNINSTIRQIIEKINGFLQE